MASNSNDQPSILSGHAQYAKGYVTETIGKAIGSEEWTESGKADSQKGIDEMKQAKQQSDSQPAATGVGGKIEEFAGKAAGCEGMEEEGKERQARAS